MSITYNNPDEVVKVKHILSLAEHIAEKIDGSSSSITPKTTPTLTASKTQYSLESFTGDTQKVGAQCILTYNGDGELFDKAAIDANLCFYVFKLGDTLRIQPYYSTVPTVPLTFKVDFTETANYKACSVEITVNV